METENNPFGLKCKIKDISVIIMIIIFLLLLIIIKDIGLVPHVAVCRTHCLSRDRGRDRENRIIAVIIFLLVIISLFFKIIITIHVSDTNSTKQKLFVTECGSQAR